MTTLRITKAQREMMLSIWHGYGKLHAIMQPLYFLHCHMPPRKLEAALTWLLLQGLKGQRFVEFLEGECEGSMLKLQAYLDARVEREPGLSTMIAGKNFI